MDRPEEEPTEKPTTSRDEAAEETAWMFQHWISIAVVSIVALVLLALGLMQWTGLIDLLGPIVDTEIGQWGVFAVLLIVVMSIAAWSWTNIVSA